MSGYPLACRLSVAVLVVLSSSCAGRSSTTPPPPPSEEVPFAPQVWLLADGQLHVGKIVEVEQDGIAFHPRPYWGTEPRPLALDDITRVEVRREGGGGRGFVWGFAAGFALIGIMAGSNAEYDEDYTAGLAGAALLGAAAGLIGAVIGSSRNHTRYDLRDMSTEERRAFLLRFRARGAEGRPEGGHR